MTDPYQERSMKANETLTAQIEQLAATLGAEAVHLVHLRQGGRWLVIVMWSADEMVRFGICDSAAEAVGAAMKVSRVDV